MDDDLAGALIVAAVGLFTGPLIWWITARVADGALPRNWLVGIRVRGTLDSDEGWFHHVRRGRQPFRCCLAPGKHCRSQAPVGSQASRVSTSTS